MGDNITIGGIVKTSIVTAFTIAAALIWKEVILDALNLIFLSEDILIYKFIFAVLSTVIVVIAIYLILKTEHEAEFFMGKLKKKRIEEEKLRKRILKREAKKELGKTL